MRVYQNPKDVPATCHGAHIVIGNFDGVHLGHQALIKAATDAGGNDALLGVLTFEPHPRSFFMPDAAPFRLTPSHIKQRHMEMLNVGLMVELAFDTNLVTMAPESFVSDILVECLRPKQVIIGWDFCFGKGRAGNAKTLSGMGRDLGFGVTIVDPVRDPENETYSSNLVRDYLAQGEPARAASLLGHLWEITGIVERGDQRGRTIGFPTANIALADYLVPKLGVYAVRAGLDIGGETVWRDGIVNIGTRPTVDGAGKPLLELHLFDFDADIYDQEWRVALVDFIRPEQKFEGLEALKEQIAADARKARQLLSARRIRAGSIGDHNGDQNGDNVH